MTVPSDSVRADLVETEPMKVCCAWCSATIREGDDSQVSHGICKPCLITFFGRPGS